VGFGRSVVRSIKLVGYFARFGAELLITRPKTRQARAAWLHRFCATALHGLGLKLTIEGEFPAKGALIANHLSYIDIIVFAALSPCVFCAKAEMEHWPLIGWMTTMAGTVYIDRGRGGSALKAKSGMKAAADAGLPVVFFPEGTTTNGETMLPFHSGLLAQAMAAEEPVTAAYLRYSLDEDNGPGVTVEDDVCYWGDRSMWPHVFRFLGLKGAHATVRFGDGPIRFSSDLLHRKRAAVEARNAVVALCGVSCESQVEAVEELLVQDS
jgi:1-acyl-sn-glycerol-3-phosphate acyltransferase